MLRTFVGLVSRKSVIDRKRLSGDVEQIARPGRQPAVGIAASYGELGIQPVLGAGMEKRRLLDVLENISRHQKLPVKKAVSSCSELNTEVVYLAR